MNELSFCSFFFFFHQKIVRSGFHSNVMQIFDQQEKQICKKMQINVHYIHIFLCNMHILGSDFRRTGCNQMM